MVGQEKIMSTFLLLCKKKSNQQLDIFVRFRPCTGTYVKTNFFNGELVGC